MEKRDSNRKEKGKKGRKKALCLLQRLIEGSIAHFHLRLIGQNFQFLFWFSRSVVSDSLRPPGLQHARPPCPSPTPGVYSNSCPLGQWCHPTISSSVIPFSSCLQSFPESGSFPVSQFFASGGQSIGASVNIQDWFPLGLTGLISLQSKGLSSSTTVQKHQFFSTQCSLWSNTFVRDYWKNHSFS